jgi:hypothetical protein
MKRCSFLPILSCLILTCIANADQRNHDPIPREPARSVLMRIRNTGFEPVLWIRLGFTADPDLAFYVNANRIRI